MSPLHWPWRIDQKPGGSYRLIDRDGIPVGVYFEQLGPSQTTRRRHVLRTLAIDYMRHALEVTS